MGTVLLFHSLYMYIYCTTVGKFYKPYTVHSQIGLQSWYKEHRLEVLISRKTDVLYSYLNGRLLCTK
jgi:hypothetical protein